MDENRDNWRRGGGNNDINKKKKLRLPRELKELGLRKDIVRGSEKEGKEESRSINRGIDRHTP